MMQKDEAPDRGELMNSVSPMCIVLERHGTWAAGLRRAPGPRSWSLREARGFVEVHALLGEQDRSLVAVELRVDTLRRTIDGIDLLLREFPRASCIVLGNHAPTAVAMLAWEAGAIAVVNSPRQVARAAAIVDRWARSIQQHHLLQAGDEGIEQQIRARLPFRAVDPDRPLPLSTRRRQSAGNDEEPIQFDPLP